MEDSAGKEDYTLYTSKIFERWRINEEYRKPVAGLGHELHHSWNYDLNNGRPGQAPNGLFHFEIDAVRFENRIRKYTKDLPRTTYPKNTSEGVKLLKIE